MIDRRRMLRHVFGLSASASAACLGSTARKAFAQTNQAHPYPTRTVRIVTPFPPGSGPDAALRLVSERLGRTWSQPVLVDNKPGGNGFIAVAAFKQGNSEGYDLIQLDNTHVTTHPLTFGKLPYDVAQDFAPLRMMLRTPFFVAVAADSPFNSIDDIVAAAKAAHGKINYGSWFIGSPGHLGALRLEAMMGIRMTHVPYRDFGQLYNAVSTKEVDWALGSAASAGGMAQSGKIRFIALAAARRDPLYPNVPATAEQPTTRGYEVTGWAGLFAPRGIPAALANKIAADIAAALAAPEVVERYRALGFEAPDLDPAAFSQLIQSETASWREIIRTANLRLD
ncbi:MAG: hypothetical protein BGN99_12580 [Alphaproteobacteria bacterium 65-37]|nr:MAG: hypothetical protein BGN99_12580 [Alphaproteobacteria bacterium 65-37]